MKRSEFPSLLPLLELLYRRYLILINPADARSIRVRTRYIYPSASWLGAYARIARVDTKAVVFCASLASYFVTTACGEQEAVGQNPSKPASSLSLMRSEGRKNPQQLSSR
jgi:hypothetical protein